MTFRSRLAIVALLAAAAGCGGASGSDSTPVAPATPATKPVSSPSVPTEPTTIGPFAKPTNTDVPTTPTEVALDVSQPSEPNVPPASSEMCRTITSLGPQWTPVGSSVQNRPLLARRFRGPGPTVLWIGGIHGDEPEGAVGTEALPTELSSGGITNIDLLQIQDSNPDGRSAKTRGNANGIDLNRNFPTSNFDPNNPKYGKTPLSQPESRLLFDVITASKPALIVVLHSWSNKSFVNFDGPATEYAGIWSKESSMEVVGSDGLGKKTPGSLGTWAGIENEIPILTVEYRNGEGAESAWNRSKKAALETLRSVPADASRSTC